MRDHTKLKAFELGDAITLESEKVLGGLIRSQRPKFYKPKVLELVTSRKPFSPDS